MVDNKKATRDKNVDYQIATPDYGELIVEMVRKIDNQDYLEILSKLYGKHYTDIISIKTNMIDENGYNIELGGNSIGKHSEETKRKISEAQLGEKNHMYGKRGELNATSKKVIELTTGKIYNSAMLAADNLQLEFSHVCSVARGDRGSHKGYVFRYLDENNKPIKNQYQATIKFKKVKESILPQFLYLL